MISQVADIYEQCSLMRVKRKKKKIYYSQRTKQFLSKLSESILKEAVEQLEISSHTLYSGSIIIVILSLFKFTTAKQFKVPFGIC